LVLFGCEITGKAVPQGRARVTKWGTYYPKTSTDYRLLLCTCFASLWHQDPIDFPVCVTVKVAGPRKGSDGDNYFKQVADALVDANVLAEDHWGIIREHHVYCFPHPDPYLEVIVERFDG
jgi:Holliday junction resolvase RusA-like endonuclease